MTYENMKDSGVPWIGNIPANWKLSKMANLYMLRNEKVSDKDYPPLSVTMKGVVPQLESVAKTDDGDNRKLVKIGDFAINSRSDRRGSCGISAYNGSVSLINTVLIPRKTMNPRYYEWLFHSELFSDEFYRWGHGIVDDLWTTRWQEMKRIFIPFPPLNEQAKIANYLDSKCAQIDAIITESKASVDEYKRWKASMIYQAVTKGLDPNVKMRDSGIPWIGDVPKNVKVSKVYRHYEITLGKMLCPKPLDTSYSLEPYLCAANVHFSGIDYDELKQMWFADNEKEHYIVRQGDLLVVEGGAGAGGCAIVGGIEKSMYVQNSIMIVRPKRKRSTRYLRYLIEMMVNRGYMDYVCNKATIPHFTKEKLAAVPFPLFDNQQAEEIVDYLDEKCMKIDSVISEKQALIAELEAYKKSLIYEAVTGKRKVE